MKIPKPKHIHTAPSPLSLLCFVHVSQSRQASPSPRQRLAAAVWAQDVLLSVPPLFSVEERYCAPKMSCTQDVLYLNPKP